MDETNVMGLMFVPEVAVLMRRTPAAVRWMVKAGTGPRSAMLGGRRVFKESEVRAWIDEQFEKAS